jgi:peptidoglycan/LPS O-acetylase OafA/YrhL
MIIGVALVLLTAHLTYAWIEMPFRNWSRIAARPYRSRSVREPTMDPSGPQQAWREHDESATNLRRGIGE